MSTAAASRTMTEAEYLDWEAQQLDVRHEFINGEILAMSGVSDAHDMLQVNLTVAIGGRLRGQPCRVRGPELRVHLTETGLYAYPDLSIVCGPPEFAPTHPVSLLNPLVVVEILSESTASYDLGPKAAHYRLRASVQTLLFIDSRRPYVQRQDRNPDGTWTLAEQTEGDLRVLHLSVPLSELYEGVTFEDPRSPSPSAPAS